MAYLANLRLGNNGWRPEVGSLTTVGKTRERWNKRHKPFHRESFVVTGTPTFFPGGHGLF